MDRIDAMLREFFAPAAPPGLGARLGAALRAARTAARALDRSFRVEATARGVRRLVPGTGDMSDPIFIASKGGRPCNQRSSTQSLPSSRQPRSPRHVIITPHQRRLVDRSPTDPAASMAWLTIRPIAIIVASLPFRTTTPLPMLNL